MKEGELERWRSELDSCDRELLALTKRRLEIVKQISSAKIESGVSLFDRSREKIVFEKAVEIATALELDPSIAESVIQVMVEASHNLQEELLSQSEQSQQVEPQNIAIIGGGGKMARLFTKLLGARGHKIDSIERDDLLEESRIKRADIVMLAVPMSVVKAVALEVAPVVREDALLCDINSLKVEVCDIFSKHCKGETLGLHPMFGPSVPGFRRQKIVVCRVTAGDRAAILENELAALGADIVLSTAQEHDKMMAIIQVLTHFHTMVMGEALRKTGVNLNETLPFMSPIYRLELAVIGRLFAQNPSLYAEIEMGNPLSASMHELFVGAAKSMADMMSKNDREEFCRSFERIRDYFDEFVEEAMTLSDAVIETVVRKP